jgi:hypothetical protein
MGLVRAFRHLLILTFLNFPNHFINHLKVALSRESRDFPKGGGGLNLKNRQPGASKAGRGAASAQRPAILKPWRLQGWPANANFRLNFLAEIN